MVIPIWIKNLFTSNKSNNNSGVFIQSCTGSIVVNKDAMNKESITSFIAKKDDEDLNGEYLFSIYKTNDTIIQFEEPVENPRVYAYEMIKSNKNICFVGGTQGQMFYAKDIREVSWEKINT